MSKPMLYIAIVISSLFILCDIARAETGLATYYTTASCQREGTSGVWTASGARFDEQALTCARRSREWGAKWKVTNLENGASIIVTQNDYGPGRGPAKRGVSIDLTPAGWKGLKLAQIGQKQGRGEVLVSVERVK